MKSRSWVIALALTLPALSACGGAQALDPGAAESLQQQVRELAAVTQDGNLELAVDRAEALKTEVQQAQESGAVTPGRAGRIQANIDAFIESIQPVETPPPVAPVAPDAPTTQPATEPAPAPPTYTAPAKGVREDSRDPGETQEDRDRERAEEAAEEAQKRAEKEEKERQKQEEEQREDD